MDYCAAIMTGSAPDKAACQIQDDVESCWSNRIERQADGLTIRFNNSHTTFTFDPNASAHRFAWRCIDAHMIITGADDTAEWTGTRLVWDIREIADGCTIALSHEGLTPRLACFDACQRGWQHFFETSLRNHLNNEPAMPETSEQAD